MSQRGSWVIFSSSNKQEKKANLNNEYNEAKLQPMTTTLQSCPGDAHVSLSLH